MTALHLRRTDPARNMCRFYRLDIQPDLFGRVLLMKQWGRVGTHGRMVAESYESEDLAAVALQQQAERKRRRGYMSSVDRTYVGVQR
jgi:predicted DNA-binding WGR domain protein